MPKGTHLSEREQGQILAYQSQGLKRSKIARKLGRSYSTVNTFLQNPDAYGKRQRPGRPLKLSERARRELIRTAKQKGMTSKRLKSELDLPVSDRTVRWELQKAPFLRYGKRSKTPKLTKRHRQARREWARKMIRERVDWDSIYYWHDLCAENESFISCQNGGGPIMVWGGFSARDTTALALLSGRQDSLDYQQTLATYLLPFDDAFYDGNYIFQHDNASIHASCDAQAPLRDVDVNVLEWPSLSPDLNPIGNVWGELARAVYRGGGSTPP